MSHPLARRLLAAALVAGAAAPALAQTTRPAQPAQPAQPAPKHHSKIKGALVGGAVGSAVGHPKLGAAAGALHQHNKNKKAGA